MRANFHISMDRDDVGRVLQLSDHLAALGKQALIAEAELTPKPGLMDRRGSGAHNDLSLELIRRSATVLEPYFSTIGSISAGRDLDTSLRKELAAIGRDAERAMFRAILGSNPHKGAIWFLGLFIAAAIRIQNRNSTEIAAEAGAIARLPDRAQPAVITHGDIARSRYGATGARGEAANGFPHVRKCGLSILRAQRAAKCSEETCRLDALLSLMSQLDGTCVLYRGGSEALSFVKSGAQAVLILGGYSSATGRKRMRELDRELIAQHISPGGCDDLLARPSFWIRLSASTLKYARTRANGRNEMEQLKFDYPSAKRPVTQRAHV